MMNIHLVQYLKRVAHRIFFHQRNLTPREKHEWTIGLYQGATPWEIYPIDKIENPVLTRKDVTDAKASFVADPFMLKVNGAWYMFFEVMNGDTGKGEIGLATSENGYFWQYQQIVLNEPFHLSYPYVFAWDAEYYMVPESWKSGGVNLYRANNFPTEWSYVTTLVKRPYIADSSLVYFEGYWWMFAETGVDFSFDTLCLYFARTLYGPWVEHPQSPVITNNPHIARPAGRLLVVNNRVIRFAQDCAPKYGMKVFAFEVEVLTPKLYSEKPLLTSAIVEGTDVGWNKNGMHHIDAHNLNDGKWIACVDGWRSVLVS